MKVGKIPEELMKQAKELGLELVKPASKEGIRKIAIGAGVGGAVSPLYSKGFDWLWSFSPWQNNIAKIAAKIGIPAVISLIALKTKLPGGNIIAGVPVGVSITEAIKALINVLSGRLSLPSTTTKTNGEPVVYDEVEPWGVFD